MAALTFSLQGEKKKSNQLDQSHQSRRVIDPN